MSKIKKIALSELYEMSSGISTTKEQAGHGSPFISFSTVFNNYFLPESLPDLMNTSEKEQKTYSIKKGDILVTRTSETIDELAMSCVALKDYPKATYSGFTKRLRPKTDGVAYHKYLAFYMRGYLFRKAVTYNAFMTLRASFNEDIFSFLNIYLPEYSQQVKIGDLLYSLEKKMSTNNKINAELEAMAKTIYDYWFLQFDFPDEEGKPYRSSGGKMVWNEQLKREIPEGWEVCQIESLLDKSPRTVSVQSTQYEKEGVIPIIDQSINYIAGYTNEKNTAISTKDGAIVFGDHTRVVKFVDFDFAKGADGTQVILTNNNKNMPQLLFYYSIKNIDLSNYGYARHFKFLKDSLILVPNEKTAQQFVALVEPFHETVKKMIFQNQELAKLRDWLLPMLMNGQVTVK